MKPIKNYTDHPALKYDSAQYIFNIGSQLCLLTEDEVTLIFASNIEWTNIGEPYANLVRFNYRPVFKAEEESIDIDPNYLSELVKMIDSCEGGDSASLLPEELKRYLNNGVT